MPFVWTINPYRGCEIGCVYCYARYTHEFLQRSARSFETQIYVKKHGIIVQETMEQAVEAFRAMSRGSHPISHMPTHLKYAVARAG